MFISFVQQDDYYLYSVLPMSFIVIGTVYP